mmetsp:Transcript_537/g.1018  ORF Transcript_537/g.1018 Transcript_537/m.1018 type:complete len:107 (+) Transcript_537:60-380(+)
MIELTDGKHVLDVQALYVQRTNPFVEQFFFACATSPGHPTKHSLHNNNVGNVTLAGIFDFWFCFGIAGWLAVSSFTAGGRMVFLIVAAAMVYSKFNCSRKISKNSG